MCLNSGMVLPQIIIKQDKGLDLEMLLEFFAMKNPLIQQTFPHFTSKKAIELEWTNTYDNNQAEIDETTSWLKDNISTLNKLAEIVANKLDCDWSGIETVTIIPALLPVAPRFIEENSMMLPFYNSHNWLLRTATHEMTHFLYFKKLADELKMKIDTEFPSEDWLISEIVAPMVVNSAEVQDIVHIADEFYTPDPNIITETKLRQIKTLYRKDGKNLVNFHKKALKEIGRDKSRPI
jgi:hypothetical protein